MTQEKSVNCASKPEGSTGSCRLWWPGCFRLRLLLYYYYGVCLWPMTMHHRHSTCHHLTSPSPTRAVSWSSLAYIFTRNPFLNKLVRKIYGSQISKFTPLPVSLWPTLACVSFREFFEFETSSHVNWINDDSILALHHWKNRSQPQINWGNASA
jgi:hypothetical protein